MVASENIQSRFLTVVKGLNPNLCFADELVEMLHISRDSAYRRLRGETTMALDEIKIICNRYKISLDSLLMPASGMVSFYHHTVGRDGFTFYDWLKSIDHHLSTLQHSPGTRIDYMAKDIPVFCYFQFPLLSAYKIYCWLKTYLGIDFQDRPFSMEIIPREYLAMGAKIFDRYSSLDSAEIWGEETVLSTLRQIEYHVACGAFSSISDALAIIDSYQEMLENVCASAASGKKGRGSFLLYRNDLMMTDNAIHLKAGEGRGTLIRHSPSEWLSTLSETYCQESEKRFLHTVSKSELISVSGERERNIYFNLVRSRIEQSRVSVKSTLVISVKSSA